MEIASRRGRHVHVWKHSPFAWHQSQLEEKVDAFGWPAFRTHGVWDSAPWAPDVDLFVRNQQLIARLDLPGWTKEHVTIEIGEEELTIRGMRLPETHVEQGPTDRCAHEFGTFFRTVPLPKGTTFEDVKATFANGILEVAIPLPRRSAETRNVVIQGPVAQP
jgi:HSP20 family protein